MGRIGQYWEVCPHLGYAPEDGTKGVWNGESCILGRKIVKSIKQLRFTELFSVSLEKKDCGIFQNSAYKNSFGLYLRTLFRNRTVC